MGIPVDTAVCPQCGRLGLFINTEDWKPVSICCPNRQKCGWKVDLKQSWPPKESEKPSSRTAGHKSVMTESTGVFTRTFDPATKMSSIVNTSTHPIYVVVGKGGKWRIARGSEITNARKLEPNGYVQTT